MREIWCPMRVSGRWVQNAGVSRAMRESWQVCNQNYKNRHNGTHIRATTNPFHPGTNNLSTQSSQTHMHTQHRCTWVCSSGSVAKQYRHFLIAADSVLKPPINCAAKLSAQTKSRLPKNTSSVPLTVNE